MNYYAQSKTLNVLTQLVWHVSP